MLWFFFPFFFSSISDWLNHLSSSVISCNWFRKRFLSETHWLERRNEKDMQYVIYFSNWLKNKESKNVKANTNKYLIVGGFFLFYFAKWFFPSPLILHWKSTTTHLARKIEKQPRNWKVKLPRTKSQSIKKQIILVLILRAERIARGDMSTTSPSWKSKLLIPDTLWGNNSTTNLRLR